MWTFRKYDHFSPACAQERSSLEEMGSILHYEESKMEGKGVHLFCVPGNLGYLPWERLPSNTVMN